MVGIEESATASEPHLSLLEDINSLLSNERVTELLAMNSTLSEKIAIANACRNLFDAEDSTLLDELQMIIAKLRSACASRG